MNRKRIAILLSLCMAFSMNMGAVTGLAMESMAESDFMEAAEDDAGDGETGQTAADEGDSAGMDEFFDESAGGSAEDEVSDVAENESEEDYIEGIFPTIPADESDDGMLTITVPTILMDDDEDDIEVSEEASERAVGMSSVPDPAELSARPDDVVSMVMPVMSNEMYNFTLDPNDFLSRYGENREYYDGNGLYFKNAGETVRYSGISDAAMAKNKSSVPAVLFASIDIEDDNNWGLQYTDIDSVSDDDVKSIAFALVPVKQEGDEQIFFKDSQISIDKKGHAEVALYLDSSRDFFDEVDGKLVEKESVSWNNIGFAVAGKMNTSADWSEISTKASNGEKLFLSVDCRMRPATAEEIEAVESGKAKYDRKTGIVEF